MSHQFVRIGEAKAITEVMILSALADAQNPDIHSDDLIHSPVMLHSSPGVGKSAIVKQIARDNDLEFIDLRLASMEASDVCGIPYVSHAGATDEAMKLSIPEWFPTQEKIDAGVRSQSGILFLDEISNAPLGVQHAAYRLVLDREVQTGVRLPDTWIVVAAGNLKDDKTGAKAVAPALANRFGTHLFTKANLEDFMAYAMNKGFNKEIIGFLNFKSSNLYTFNAQKSDVAFATPRTWEQVNGLLNKPFSDDQFARVLAGCVGEGVANDFMAFRKYYERLPNFQKIMDGEMDYKVDPKDKGLVFAIASALITNLHEHGSDKDKVKNLGKVMDQLGDEFLVLIYKTLKTLSSENDQKMIAQIVVNTMHVYNRITKYTKND